LYSIRYDDGVGVMTEFHKEIDIDAPPEVVWAIMRDVEHWPEWTPTVTSIQLSGGGPLRVGSRAIVRQPKLPTAKWRVTERGERSFTWVSWAPGVRVIAQHRVEALGTVSRATLSLRYTGLFGGLLAYLTRGVNDPYLALEAKGLKDLSESRARQ
jgi:uncharacterized membrane protein